MGERYDRIMRIAEMDYDLHQGHKEGRRKIKADKNQKRLYSLSLGIGFICLGFSEFIVGAILISVGILGLVIKSRLFKKR